MEIKTKLSMHQRVVMIFNGKIVSLEVNEIKFRIVPADEKDGGSIEYSGIRRDKAIGRDASYDKQFVGFSEEDLGRTVWLDKDEMLAYFQGQEVEPDFWR